MAGYQPAADSPIRYVIRGDNSGHEYFIPVGEENRFEAWVATFEDDYEASGEEVDFPDFEANRIDGRFTFTDPRCD